MLMGDYGKIVCLSASTVRQNRIRVGYKRVERWRIFVVVDSCAGLRAGVGSLCCIPLPLAHTDVHESRTWVKARTHRNTTLDEGRFAALNHLAPCAIHSIQYRPVRQRLFHGLTSIESTMTNGVSVLDNVRLTIEMCNVEVKM